MVKVIFSLVLMLWQYKSAAQFEETPDLADDIITLEAVRSEDGF